MVQQKMPKMPQNKPGFVCVGVVTGAHGVKGEVKLKTFTEDPFSVLDYGHPQTYTGEKIVFAALREGAQGLLLAKIKGLNSRTQAETWRGTALYVPAKNLPKPAEGEVYFSELPGMDVCFEDGRLWGTVNTLYDTGANAVLVVQLATPVQVAGKAAAVNEVLLPYTGDVVLQVNRASNRLVVSALAQRFAEL